MAPSGKAQEEKKRRERLKAPREKPATPEEERWFEPELVEAVRLIEAVAERLEIEDRYGEHDASRPRGIARA